MESREAIRRRSWPTGADMSAARSNGSARENLVVDDAPTVAEILSAAFPREGFQASRFRDENLFLATARRRRPACVLFDVGTPGVSGLEGPKNLDARQYPGPE